MSSGITETLRSFYDAHARELFVYALSITRNEADAEDAVHDAFAAVLRNGVLPRELRPYLFRCVRNAGLDARENASRESLKSSIFATQSEDPALLVQVEELLDLLSEDERECVVLKNYAGMTFNEIAGVLREPFGTVAARYWRALSRVRARLEIRP